MSLRTSNNVIVFNLKQNQTTNGTNDNFTIPFGYINKGTYYMCYNLALTITTGGTGRFLPIITINQPYNNENRLIILGLTVSPVNTNLLPNFIDGTANIITITNDNTPLYWYLSTLSNPANGWRTSTTPQNSLLNKLCIFRISN